jgi:hypothetical protein
MITITMERSIRLGAEHFNALYELCTKHGYSRCSFISVIILVMSFAANEFK